MQINIDKKTGILLSIIGALLIAIVLAASGGMRDSDSDNDDMGMMGGHGHNSNSQMVGSDAMFLQMMIPHHQQAIDISNIALKTSKDAELLTLAKTIIKAQTAEIVQMKSWLNDAGATTDMGHSMSGMGGMLDDAELSVLSAASGKNFDLLWLKGMIGHHDGAIHMTTMIRDASNADIKTFGENVVKDQSAQIVQMNAMLKRIG